LCRCILFQQYDISAYTSTSVRLRLICVDISNALIFTEVARLGKRLGVRQQAMATAQLYIRRFYSKVEIRRTNPYLVIATAVYLACKMEECPYHIRLVVSEGRTLWPGMFESSGNS
jgi:transcription initiation factor TFIIIB Brf1 subunit/transcription initiation factor TFIIB